MDKQDDGINVEEVLGTGEFGIGLPFIPIVKKQKELEERIKKLEEKNEGKK